ncbi:hypothetical protein [Christiangramia portivictoriae]|uniref:hypothetical protein n=1 Tax=Christiangramia portivictoriae TaxID=326069 RepID=UPI0003F677A2|nr:hypothetical protein [Christiangramia portivictoriae]
MNRIEKSPHFLRGNMPYVLGGFYVLMGVIAYFIIGDAFYLSYLIIGIVAAGIGYFRREHRKEFIKWNSKKIVLQDQINGKKSYSWTAVDDFIISEENLLIKSGAADGVYFEIREFSQTDIAKLRSAYPEFANLKHSA